LATDAVVLAGLLADTTRRRVFAALVLGDRTVDQVRESTGLTTREILRAVTRLVDGGLVVAGRDGMYFVVEGAFTAAIRGAAPAVEDEHADTPAQTARVLRAFVRGGRLTSIPTQHAKRLVVLDLVAQDFEPGQRYTERQVNSILRRWHDDAAALRRHLVDDGFMARDHGEYWRAGGTIDP
jgi:hypothetical protein